MKNSVSSLQTKHLLQSWGIAWIIWISEVRNGIISTAFCCCNHTLWLYNEVDTEKERLQIELHIIRISLYSPLKGFEQSIVLLLFDAPTSNIHVPLMSSYVQLAGVSADTLYTIKARLTTAVQGMVTILEKCLVSVQKKKEKIKVYTK